MRHILAIPAAALAASVMLAPLTAHAADQRGYGYTGDSQIPALNEAQLNRNYTGPWYYPNGTEHPTAAPPPGTMMVMPPAYAAPPPGNYAPQRY